MNLKTAFNCQMKSKLNKLVGFSLGKKWDQAYVRLGNQYIKRKKGQI